MTAPVPIRDLIGPVVADLARRSGTDLARWLDQVDRLRGCREPIRLTGETMTVDAGTGELLHHYTTEHEPHGQLMVRCGNRRASRCPACAETYRADTYHLIKAGLIGGAKGVPEHVRDHPRVFATLTAPSFGPVHTGPVHTGPVHTGPVHTGPDRHEARAGKGRVCHPRRTGPACWRRHSAGDPAIGQPIDPDSYDYTGHVLWHAHAGDLWARFTIYLRRALARRAGLTHAAFNRTARVAFAKVAEYQQRATVHFHAVIRIDGRPTPGTDQQANTGPCPPPAWATSELLEAAIREAAAAVHLDAPDAGDATPRTLTWGDQVDVRAITGTDMGGDLTEQAVAGYIAKYATKAAETTGTLDRPVNGWDLAHLETRGLTPHTAALIRTCWKLGARPELAHLRLRKWAHMLGFRGHFSTKSRTYSTTLGALRQTRADYAETARRDHLNLPAPDTTLVLAHWQYAGQGYTQGEAVLAGLPAPETRDGRTT